MLQICCRKPMANDSRQQRYEEAFDSPCNPQFPCPLCSTQASEEDTMKAMTNKHARTHTLFPSSTHTLPAAETIKCCSCYTSSAPPTNVGPPMLVPDPH